VLDRLERELGVKAGDTTTDGMFSIEVVACIGACGLAPVISVDGNYHANLTEDDVPEVLDSYRTATAKEA
jgi:NADH:ubiquinone oxidoreductase subunit E